MTFAAMSPAAVGVAALATTIAVVALYLLRRRPRTQTVSNIEFWRRAAERSRPRSLLATRVPWIAMLLSLVTALLIVLEMGDPRTSARFSGTTVIVLDVDRTMSARDDHGRARIDDALAVARQIVRADTTAGQVAIVRAGTHPEVVLPLTHRATDAERVLDQVETEDGTADLPGAIAIARGIVRNAGTPGRVVLIADRRDAAPSSEQGIPMVFEPVGDPGETVAISALDARRDPLSLGEYWIRCEIRSYASHPAHAHLVIRDREIVISDQRVNLAPGEVVTQRAHGFSSGQAELSARFDEVTIEGGHDALASDDVAYAAVPPAVTTRVLLVTRGNRYLENALAANPAVHLDVVNETGLASRRNAVGGLARYQVIVLDRVAPHPPLDHPAELVVGVTDPSIVRLGRELAAPRITAFATDHRVLAGLRFDQVHIARARALEPDADDRVLARSGRDALAIARDRDGSRMVALGFDTDETDLVQRIAFPLFVHNALVWLDRRERDFHSWQAPGEPIRAPGSTALVLMPSGEGREVRNALYETGHAGIYHTTDRAVAVNAAGEAGALDAVMGHTTSDHASRHSKPPLGVLIAGFMLALISVEWFLTQRGRLQ